MCHPGIPIIDNRKNTKIQYEEYNNLSLRFIFFFILFLLFTFLSYFKSTPRHACSPYLLLKLKLFNSFFFVVLKCFEKENQRNFFMFFNSFYFDCYFDCYFQCLYDCHFHFHFHFWICF